MSVVTAGLLIGIMVTVQGTVSTYSIYEGSAKTHYVKTGIKVFGWLINLPFWRMESHGGVYGGA
jgi:hypothetical protein